MDFRSPQNTVSINNFPVSFRKLFLPDEGMVWVPRGISRNRDGKCWRYYIVSEEGVYTGYEYDTEKGPVDSLSKAYAHLQDILSESVSRFSVDLRSKSPGHERDPVIDTKHTGVAVSRSVRSNRKKLVVVCNQMIKRPNGRIEAQGHYLGSIDEEKFVSSPKSEEKRFFEMIRQAIIIHRAYRSERSQGIYRQHTLRYDEVPAEIKDKPVDLPKLDIDEIFDSYMVTSKEIVPRTTGGDLQKLIEKLRSRNLFEPHTQVFVRGHCLRVYPTVVGDKKVWLPKTLFYVEDHWRIKLPKKGGWLSCSFHHSDFEGDPIKSLNHAWDYLIDAYQNYDAGDHEGAGKMKEPLLSTGMEGVFIQPGQRIAKKSNKVRWSFSVVIRQRVSETETKSRAVGRWFIEDLNDSELEFSLRKAAAMIAYKNSLMEKGYSAQETFVETGDVIPSEYWPEDAPCPVYADDIRFWLKKKENQ